MTQRYRSSFSLSDGILLALAAIGLIVFFVLLPAQHPYSAADYAHRDVAIEAAERFLAEAGFTAPADAAPEAHLRVNGPVLDTLQRTLGRAEAIRLIASEEGQRLGAYHWRVVWPDPDLPEQPLALARLTPDGRVLKLEVRQAGRLQPTLATTEESERLPGGVDSVVTVAPHERVRALLAHTAFAGTGLRVDSMETMPNLYRAYLSGADVSGRPVRIEMHLDGIGQLLRLESAFVQSPPDTLSPRDIYGFSIIALYVLLLVGVLVTFFRRLTQRLVDTRAALRDALWVGLAGMGWMVSVVLVYLLRSGAPLWMSIGTVLFNMFIGGLGTAFIAFAASGAGDSVARPVWPERLASLQLLRRGLWKDARVGGALVRGMAGAGLTLGLITVLLLLLPRVVLRLGADSGPMPDEAALSPALFVACFYTVVVVFYVYAVLLVVGGAVRRKSSVAAAILMVLLLASMQLIVLSDAPGWQFAFHLIPAGIAVWLFHRYDTLTAFVMLLVYSMLWDLSYTWMGQHVPSLTGMYVLGGVLVLLLVIGLVVMVQGRRVQEDQMLVPSYIRERQYEARMERELEIAHNVQMTFLPRQMPTVAGLDVAALCLPAMEVGGDYYDFVKLDDRRLALVIGDVSGKGIQAAFYMTLVKGFIRTLAREELSPVEVLRRVNRLFYECAPRGTFISMIYGVVDVEARTFTFSRAGHNPVILHRAPSQQADMLQPPGLAIGLDAGPRFDSALCEETLRLGVGDTLVLYTDGFSEAMNPDRALFGDLRLAEQASDLHGPSARHLLDALTRSVNVFMKGAEQHDDMTMIVLRFTLADA